MPTTQKLGTHISPGMLITSYEQIAEGVKYTEYGVPRVPNRKTIKGVLDWLESNSMIARESNRHGTVIFINNWHTYQNQDDAKVTPDGQSKKHQLDTTKEVKEVKESKESKEVKKKKGARNSPRSAIPFHEYKKQHPVEEETAAAIEFFLKQYERHQKKPHPNLKPAQWGDLCSSFMSCPDERDSSFTESLDLEAVKAMIARYFTTKFENCDYRIHHFNTPGVKLNRIYEEVLIEGRGYR